MYESLLVYNTDQINYVINLRLKTMKAKKPEPMAKVISLVFRMQTVVTLFYVLYISSCNNTHNVEIKLKRFSTTRVH